MHLLFSKMVIAREDTTAGTRQQKEKTPKGPAAGCKSSGAAQSKATTCKPRTMADKRAFFKVVQPPQPFSEARTDTAATTLPTRSRRCEQPRNTRIPFRRSSTQIRVRLVERKRCEFSGGNGLHQTRPSRDHGIAAPPTPRSDAAAAAAAAPGVKSRHAQLRPALPFTSLASGHGAAV